MATTTPPSNRKRNILIAFIAVIVLLDIALIYNIVSSKNEKIAEKEKEVEKTKKEFKEYKSNTDFQLDSLRIELEDRIEYAKKIGADYEALESLKAEIEKDRDNLRKNAGSNDSKYKKKIADYEEALRKKDEELDDFRKSNKALLDQNDELKKDRENTQRSIEELRSKQDQITEKIEKYASDIKLTNVYVTAVNTKGIEKTPTQYKSRQIERLKIYFNFVPNSNAKVGAKTIYLRIVEPSGTVLSAGNQFDEASGQKLYYSSVQDFSFDNTQKTLNLVYNRGGEFRQGRHTAELYLNGQFAGSTYFDIK